MTTDRRWPKKDYTIGNFYIGEKKLFNTLEDTDRGLDSSMPTIEILRKKIYGRTAIPKGTYKVVLSYSPKFRNRVWAKKYGGLVPEIIGVKGYSGARIHPANSAEELEGCIAPGDNKKVGKVLNSQRRYYELMDNYLMPAHERGEIMWITIK